MGIHHHQLGEEGHAVVVVTQLEGQPAAGARGFCCERSGGQSVESLIGGVVLDGCHIPVGSLPVVVVALCGDEIFRAAALSPAVGERKEHHTVTVHLAEIVNYLRLVGLHRERHTKGVDRLGTEIQHLYVGSSSHCSQRVIDGIHLSAGIVVGKLHRTVGTLRPIIGRGGHVEPVVELPKERGPGRIEHPVDDTRGARLVGAECLEHSLRALQLHQVGALQEDGQAVRGAEAPVHGLAELVEGVHGGGRGRAVVVVVVVASYWPRMFAPHDALHILPNGQLGADTGL